MKQIIFATGNAGKMKEIREILNGTGWNVLSLKDAGIDAEIEENGITFEENAKIKAEGIRNWCLENGIPGCSGISAKEIIVLADDSGLEVDALNGEPGIYSARYMGHETSYHIKNHQPSGRRPERKAHSTFCLCYCSSPAGRKQSCDARNDRGLYRLGRVRQQRIWI